jgi:hypothetical protein
MELVRNTTTVLPLSMTELQLNNKNRRVTGALPTGAICPDRTVRPSG